jgi:hypothetical protein
MTQREASARQEDLAPFDDCIRAGHSGLESLRGRLTCSIPEAASMLEIGRSTAYAAAKDGSLPVLRMSHRLLVSVPRLLALLGIDESRPSQASCDSNGDCHE